MASEPDLAEPLLANIIEIETIDNHHKSHEDLMTSVLRAERQVYETDFDYDTDLEPSEDSHNDVHTEEEYHTLIEQDLTPNIPPQDEI